MRLTETAQERALDQIACVLLMNVRFGADGGRPQRRQLGREAAVAISAMAAIPATGQLPADERQQAHVDHIDIDGADPAREASVILWISVSGRAYDSAEPSQVANTEGQGRLRNCSLGIFNRATPKFVKNWRKRWDSNPRCDLSHARFQDESLQPLGHASIPFADSAAYD